MKNLICNHIEILLSVISVYLRFLIGKRRFNRRGPAGLPYFKSCGALVTVFIEKSVNITATLMIICGNHIVCSALIMADRLNYKP